MGDVISQVFNVFDFGAMVLRLFWVSRHQIKFLASLNNVVGDFVEVDEKILFSRKKA